jgi:hydrogenase nickel incorporation protein HypA/HybF
MHELSIAQALIGQVEKIARTEGAASVTGVTITVGILSGVDYEALRFAFPLAAEGTVAESAELVVEKVEATVACHDCKETTSPKYPFFVCAKCGSANVEIVTGRELQLKSIEVDV